MLSLMGRDDLSGYERLRKQLRASGALPEGVREDDAVRVVLGRLLRRVPGGTAVRMLDELPREVLQVLGDEAPDRDARPEVFNHDQLILDTARALSINEGQADELVRAMLRAVRPLVTPETAALAAQQLPKDLQELWGSPVAPPELPAEEMGEAVLNHMLEDVQHTLSCGEDEAWTTLTRVLCVLEQRVAGGHVRRLMDQLPRNLRTAVFECRTPSEHAPPSYGPRHFIELIEHALNVDHVAAEDAIIAVFNAIRPHISVEEARDISAELPMDLKSLWWGNPPKTRRHREAHPEHVAAGEPERAGSEQEGQPGSEGSSPPHV